MNARIIAGLALIGSLAWGSAAQAHGGNPVLGAVIGAGAGVALGHAVGGRDGAIVGAVIGTVAGTVIASQHGRVVVTQPHYPTHAYPPPGPVTYYPPPVYRAAPVYVPAPVYAPRPVHPAVVYGLPVYTPPVYAPRVYSAPVYAGPPVVVYRSGHRQYRHGWDDGHRGRGHWHGYRDGRGW
jgi:hypothetical protein